MYALAEAQHQAVVLLKCDGASVALSTDQATEAQVHVQLAEVQARIDQPKGVEVTDRLIRLGEMLDKGQLTQEEFAAAKAKLLS